MAQHMKMTSGQSLNSDWWLMKFFENADELENWDEMNRWFF